MSINNYKTALVTGASSGIGAALTRSLSALGVKVHAVARREQRLAALKEETGCETHTLDLRDSASIKPMFGELDIDILVNNAGHGRGFEGVCGATSEDIDSAIDTNVRAVYHLLGAIVPGMMQRNRGHIVNIGSMAGRHTTASAIYGGTKGAIHMLSRNLRLEVVGKQVRVTEICPGRVATEFYDQAIDDAATRDRLKTSGIEELSAEQISDTVLFALQAPANMNVNLIELQPVEQTYGGTAFTPITDS